MSWNLLESSGLNLRVFFFFFSAVLSAGPPAGAQSRFFSSGAHIYRAQGQTLHIENASPSTSVYWVETLRVQAPAISALFLPPLPGADAPAPPPAGALGPPLSLPGPRVSRGVPSGRCVSRGELCGVGVQPPEPGSACCSLSVPPPRPRPGSHRHVRAARPSPCPLPPETPHCSPRLSPGRARGRQGRAAPSSLARAQALKGLRPLPAARR